MIWITHLFTNHKLSKSTEAAAEQLRKQEPKVNSIYSYLKRRELENGFGDDFEYTLRPRRAK